MSAYGSGEGMGLKKSAVPCRLNYIPLGRKGMGLLERTHLSDKTPQSYAAARIAVCMATS